MYKIIQQTIGRQAAIFCDEFIAFNDGSLIYGSMFGPAMAIKAITAQILQRRPMLSLIDTQNNVLVKSNYGSNLTILRGSEDFLRIITRTVKPGVVHKLFYADNMFRPWCYDSSKKFLVYGKDWIDAAAMAFKIIDKKSSVPLKAQWQDWLWEKLDEWQHLDVVQSKTLPEPFKFFKVMETIPDSKLEYWIKQDLDELKDMSTQEQKCAA